MIYRYEIIKNKNGKYNIKDKKLDKIVFDECFDFITKEHSYIYVLNKNRKCNVLNYKMKFIFNTWFEHIYQLDVDLLGVQRTDNKFNISNDGVLILDNWVDGVSRFQNGYGHIWIDNIMYSIDKQGNIIYCVDQQLFFYNK